MKRLRALSLSGLAAISMHGAAWADTSDEQKAAARMLGTDGVKLAMAGDCPHAVDKLTRAEALLHAPTTAVWLGQCDIQLGRLVAGTEILNRVLRESLPEGAPKSWVDAKQRAQGLFDAAEPRIAKLTIHVDRPTGVEPQVTIDGEAVPSVLLDNERPTDPGTHHVMASALGLTAATADVSLTDGQSARVSLRLEGQAQGATWALSAQSTSQPPQVQGASPQAAQAQATQPVPPAPASTPNRAPAFVSFGIGAAGLVFGSVFGVVALGDKSRLDSACVDKGCPQSSQSDIDAMHRDSLLSTIGIGVGVVGAALGTIFLVTAHGDDSPKTARMDVHPWFGPGSAGVGGTFP
jgi:hypothetical protein